MTWSSSNLSRGLCVLLTAFLLANAGCISRLSRWTARGWVADYDTAERRVRQSGKELLIFYLNDREKGFAHVGNPTDDDIVNGNVHAMDRALRSDPLKSLSSKFVCCTLVRSYEPDRRYVAQFGVDRAPALIYVHRDGTYHATTGKMSVGQIKQFLAGSHPPGLAAHLNPYLLHEPLYDWCHSVEEAEAVSRRTGRPMLIVCYRSLSRDWRTLKKLLSTPEVYLRLADLVPARIKVSRFSSGAPIPRFGSLQLPALIIAQTDGTFHVLELPRSSAAVVRFADASLSGDGLRKEDTTATGAAGRSR